MPLYQKIIPLLLALWALTFFISKLSRSYFDHLIKNKTGLLGISFFLLSVLSLTYTDNWSSGTFDVESKLSFIIFPLVLSSSVYYYSHLIIKRIFLSFISGLIISSIYCLSVGFYRIIALDAPFQYLTYTDLSVFMHPSYFSMYLSMGLLFTYYIWKNSTKQIYRTSIYCALIALFFATMIVLLSSKTGIIVLLLLLLLIANDMVKKKLRLLLAVVLLVSIFAGVFFTNPRFKSMREQLTAMFKTEQYEKVESNALRVILWENALELIGSNWFKGVSAGDLKYDLTEKSGIVSYDDNGNRIYFNAHNQWIETFLANGIVGFLIIFLWFFVPLRESTGRFRTMLIGAFLILFINGFFESIFNKQEGIIFAVLIWTLLSALTNKFVQQKLT